MAGRSRPFGMSIGEVYNLGDPVPFDQHSAFCYIGVKDNFGLSCPFGYEKSACVLDIGHPSEAIYLDRVRHL